MSIFDQVLITGGSGYFGRACVQRLLERPDVRRVCVYSRGEYAQAQMRDQFHDDPRLRWFIGDVRDFPRLRWAMDGIRTVIHAAALKRIEVGAYNPEEMVKTNIVGAMNVIAAAREPGQGVERVVALSSDKAYQPISPYGQSKALAESLFLTANDTSGGRLPRFAVVRYGNVSGSTGSIIPRWREMLKTTDTVPVTNPDCTRFWMSIDEAVDLVLDTAANMRGGELAIPSLPAYRLGDLAEAMGAKTDVRGLPIYEKAHEGMADGNTSDIARRMSVDEIRERLRHVA